MNMPLNREGRRRYKKSKSRRVWVFSEVNRDLRPEQIAKILVDGGLEQARKEAEARADLQTRAEANPASLATAEDEVDHA